MNLAIMMQGGYWAFRWRWFGWWAVMWGTERVEWILASFGGGFTVVRYNSCVRFGCPRRSVRACLHAGLVHRRIKSVRCASGSVHCVSGNTSHARCTNG